MINKRITAIAAAAVIALSLAACGDNNNGELAEPATPASAVDADNVTTTAPSEETESTTTTTTTAAVTEKTETSAVTTAPEEQTGKYTTTEVSTDADGNYIYNLIDDIDLGGEVVYDENGIKVSMVKFTIETDDILDMTIGSVVVDIENNTDRNIIVSLDDYRVNEAKVSFLWTENITEYAGKSSTGHFSATGGQMIGDTGFNFNDIEKITFNIEIKEDVTNDLIADPIPYEISFK